MAHTYIHNTNVAFKNKMIFSQIIIFHFGAAIRKQIGSLTTRWIKIKFNSWPLSISLYRSRILSKMNEHTPARTMWALSKLNLVRAYTIIYSMYVYVCGEFGWRVRGAHMRSAGEKLLAIIKSLLENFHH